MPQWLNVVLKVAATTLILALFAWKMDVRLILRTMSAIPLFAVLAAIVIVLVQSGIASLRLILVLARFGAQLRVWNALQTTLEGMFFSQTFVSFVGGDTFRIWRIRRLGLSLTDAVSAIVFDRLIGIMTNHLVLLASLPWLLTAIRDPAAKLVIILIAIAGVVGFALLLLFAFLRGRSGFLPQLRGRIPIKPVVVLIIEVSSVGRHFLLPDRRLLAMVVASALIAVANAMVFAVVLLGMGVSLETAVGCALLVPAVMEVAMLPISIASWGIREGAAVVAFGALGLPAYQAFGSSIAFGLVLAGVSLLGGILWIADRRKMPETGLNGGMNEAGTATIDN